MPDLRAPDLTGLRRAALVAVLCGQAAAAVAGVLPWPVLLLAAGLLVAACRASAQARPGPVVLRRVATVLALALAVVLLPGVLDGGDDGPRGVLGPLLVGVAVVQALTWSSRRDLQAGLLCAVGLLVLGASFAPDVLVGLPLLAGWVAALVGGLLAARARAAEGADVVLVAVSPRAPVAVAAAVATVLGLAAFLLVPVPEDAGLRSRLAGLSAEVGSGGRAVPGAYSGGSVDLRTRGTLSDQPLLQVRADSPPLWRGAVYDRWDGTAWSRPEQFRRVTGPPYAVGPAGADRSDQVAVLGRTDGTVWAPGDVATVAPLQRPRFVAVDELGALRIGSGAGYVVDSAVVSRDAEVLRGAVGEDVDDPRWLALPPSTSSRTRALATELVAGAATRADAVRAVESWVRDNATYDLDSPVPAPGEDAVDRFLFVDRIGFCEQFAAAEVVLLRAAGIPARFATGFGYGEDRGDGSRVYRQKDLHAWVEVFHPGVGWSASDPTPAASVAASRSVRERLVVAITRGLRAAEAVPGGRPALAVALVALTALVALALRRRPRRRTTKALDVEAVTGVGPALAAFLRWDARLGPDRRRPAESLAELRGRVRPAPDVATAIAVVEDECYAAQDPADAGRAARVLDGSVG